MLKQVEIVLLLALILNQSQAEPQNSFMESFNLGYPNPYSSLSDTQSGDLPFQAYTKLLDVGVGFDDEKAPQQMAGGRFLWTIYVTQTRYKGSYLRTSYCTTSTAAISICTPSAGRRKRFSKGVRGLFFDEKEEESFLSRVALSQDEKSF